MKQKVIKIGSSIGVVLPKPVAEKLGFKAGQEINLNPTANGGVTIDRITPQSKSAENSKLIAWAEEAVERYRPALEALKNK
jgi:putative addiction module antidote